MVSLREKQIAAIIWPQTFPKLKQVGFTPDDVTSSKTPKYNCIAYAAKDETRPWWPLPYEYGGSYYYWPPDLPREQPATVKNFFKAFETLGYKRCSNGRHEFGFEKVAIYVDDNDVPQHMARELGDGVWYSKLGNGQDIRHYILETVEHEDYGKAKYFMRKSLEGYTRWKRVKEKIRRVFRRSKTLKKNLVLSFH